MKNYGRDGRLKSEKKKKRKFEVIMNTGTHGIYSDFTLRKVAKKATINLARKKKHIIFHLREKEKSEKIYGPYIGYIKDGKVIVKFYKMSGGVEPIFSNEEKRSFFAKNGENNIKIIKEEDKYFICCFGISSSSNYKYFVYFDNITKSSGINFYKINDNLTFEEVDITSIDSRLLLTLIQLLENKKNRQINSINDAIINIIIDKIKEKVPKIKKITNIVKEIKKIQSTNNKNNGCILNSPSIKDFKASPTAQHFTIKRRKFCITRRTLLFYNNNNFLTKDGIMYYQYVIYGERDNILLFELVNNNGKLEKTKIHISNIGKKILERIRNEIIRVRGSNTKNKDFAEKILKVVEAEIGRQTRQQPPQPQQPQQLQQSYQLQQPYQLQQLQQLQQPYQPQQLQQPQQPYQPQQPQQPYQPQQPQQPQQPYQLPQPYQLQQPQQLQQPYQPQQPQQPYQLQQPYQPQQPQQPYQPQQPQQPSFGSFSSFSKQPIQQMPLDVYSKLLNSALLIQNPLQQPQKKSINKLNSSSFINKPKIIKNNQKFSNYICSQNPILEVNKNDVGIFFGYDPNLSDQSLFYYKYSYRENKFYLLQKYNNGALYESLIELSQIPLYDLLCLYEFAKNKSLVELMEKFKENILRKNKSETVSESKAKIESSLSEKNFNKEKNTNIGKIKRKKETLFKEKTYYFFGKSGDKFLYVCYRESDRSNENVYYYNQQTLNDKRKPLSDLQDIDALKDLKSFIILRQIQDPKFGGEIVCEKAGEIIRKIKTQQLHKII
jgi:hypothetical protein